MNLKAKAKEFLIWRAGNSVGWDCTYADISKETGINRDNVRLICIKRGWKCASGRVVNSECSGGRQRVDALINSPYLADHGHD